MPTKPTSPEQLATPIVAALTALADAFSEACAGSLVEDRDRLAFDVERGERRNEARAIIELRDAIACQVRVGARALAVVERHRVGVLATELVELLTNVEPIESALHGARVSEATSLLRLGWSTAG